MSAPLRARVGVVAAGLFCWLLGSAIAAEINTSTGQINSPQAREDATNRAGQIDRAQAPQPGARVLRGQPYAANYRGAQANSAQAGQEVERYLVNCMLNNNKAEVELSQFAEQQTQNPEVKQFAAQLAKDHQQFVQKLEQIAGTQASAGRTRSSAFDANAPTGTDRTTLEATGKPGPNATETAAPLAATNGNSALHQLAAIEQKINERCQQSLREELQQKTGAEFDACFLGAQIGGHMHMLAALEVIPQETQGPLKQVAEEARPIVQKHLAHAKQLMAQLKAGEHGPAATAERTTTATQQQ
jgi:predicted outer membrane protein